MTTMIFIRHGFSEANRLGYLNGQADAPLTDLGRRQAQNTADYLKDYPIDAVYASDLERAVETARAIAAPHGMEVRTDPALRELNIGEWEGKRMSEVERDDPEEYFRYLHDTGRFHPKGGESALECANRLYAAVDRIAETNRGKCVAVVTHGFALRMLACRWKGIPPEDVARCPYPNNASVSVIEYGDDGAIRVLLDDYDGHQGNCSTKLEWNE